MQQALVMGLGERGVVHGLQIVGCCTPLPPLLVWQCGALHVGMQERERETWAVW
jgi:hypothetical protein